MMGDALEATLARFRARVIGNGAAPGPLTLHVFRDGVPFLHVPVPNVSAGDQFDFEFVGPAPGDYRLQVMRGTAIEAITNPINLRLPGDSGGPDDPDEPSDREPPGHGGRPSEPGPPHHAPAKGRD